MKKPRAPAAKGRRAKKPRGDGVALIAAVREQQKAKWSVDHDDEHRDGELAWCAAELLMVNSGGGVEMPHVSIRSDEWGLCHRFGAYPLQRLSVAGALIAAEIDRRLRTNEHLPPRRAKGRRAKP